MNSPLKIGIVEDDLIIAESIAIALEQIGYAHTQPVRNYMDALRMIEKDSPDLLLIDIMIDGEKDGIDLATTVNKSYSIPFIFLTGNSDHATVTRAKEVKPSAYIVKPFSENDLYTSIEIAFNNYNQLQPKQQTHPTSSLKNFIFIKEGELFHKLDENDILFLESDNVYLTIHTEKKHFVIREKMDDFIAAHSNLNFFRVHRSYAINLKHLETINAATVKVGSKEVPLHKTYRQELLKAIDFLK